MSVSFADLRLILKLKGKYGKNKRVSIKTHFHGFQNNFFSVLHEVVNKSGIKGCDVKKSGSKGLGIESRKQSKSIKCSKMHSFKVSSNRVVDDKNTVNIKSAKLNYILTKSNFNELYRRVECVNEWRENKSSFSVQKYVKYDSRKCNLNFRKDNINEEKRVNITTKNIALTKDTAAEEDIIKSNSVNEILGEIKIDKFNMDDCKVIRNIVKRNIKDKIYEYNPHRLRKNININHSDDIHSERFVTCEIEELGIKSTGKKSIKINSKNFHKVSCSNKNVYRSINLDTTDISGKENIKILRNINEHNYRCDFDFKVYQKRNVGGSRLLLSRLSPSHQGLNTASGSLARASPALSFIPSIPRTSPSSIGIINEKNYMTQFKHSYKSKITDARSSRYMLLKIRFDDTEKKKDKLDQYEYNDANVNKINLKLSDNIKVEDIKEVLYKDDMSVSNLNHRSNYRSADSFFNANTKNIAFININEDKLKGSIKIITHNHDNVKIIFNVDDLLRGKIVQALPDLKSNLHNQGFNDVVFSFGDFLKHKKEEFKRSLYSGNSRKISVNLQHSLSILNKSLNFRGDSFNPLKDYTLNLLA